MALLNAGFAHLNLPIRCLPLQVGKVKLFRKVIEAVKLRGVVVDDEQQAALRNVASELDADAVGVSLNPGGLPAEHAVDLLVQSDSKQWQGAHTFSPGAVAALEAALSEKGRTLDGAIVMIAGLTATSRSVARATKERGGKMIFASANKPESAKMCRMLGGRQVLPEAVYTTLHDVAVISREDSEKPDLHPGFLKAGMFVMDLTDLPRETPLTREARKRGCSVVSPQAMLIEQVRRQLRRLTNQDVPSAVLEEVMNSLLEDE